MPEVERLLFDRDMQVRFFALAQHELCGQVTSSPSSVGFVFDSHQNLDQLSKGLNMLAAMVADEHAR